MPDTVSISIKERLFNDVVKKVTPMDVATGKKTIRVGPAKATVHWALTWESGALRLTRDKASFTAKVRGKITKGAPKVTQSADVAGKVKLKGKGDALEIVVHDLNASMFLGFRVFRKKFGITIKKKLPDITSSITMPSETVKIGSKKVTVSVRNPSGKPAAGSLEITAGAKVS